MAQIANPVLEGIVLDSIPRGIWIRIGALYAMLGVTAWFLEPTIGPEDWWLHGIWCVVGLAVGFPTVFRMFRLPFTAILADHRLMFLASFSLYFLFGAALLAFGPDRQVEESLRYYPIGARDAMRVNAVNGLGFGLALMVSGVSQGRWLQLASLRAATLLARVPPLPTTALFLVVGIGTYAYVLLFDLGLHDEVIPGIVRALSNLSLVAIVLAAAYRGRGEQFLRALSAALVLVLAVGGMLQFNKTQVLVAIASFTAGLSLRFGSKWVIPAGLVLMVGGYLLLGGPVASGRSAVLHEGVRTLSERWNFVRDEWAQVRSPFEDERNGAWARLSYTVAQAAALDFRDAGQGGDGFEMIGWAFVPRLLVLDKPEMTKTGREFHEKITGQERASSTGQGVFASGYYHGGLWGLVVASVICGWIVAQTSAIARAIVASRAFLLYPFCLLGLYIAFRIDGDFVADYVGAFVFILYPILALALISSVVRLSRRRAPRASG